MAKNLFLLFTLDENRFAVTTDLITEIIPLVSLIEVPKTEPYVCGLFNYRGLTIPVIDMVTLLYNKTHHKKICTRILIVSIEHDECTTRVGLIAEKVHKTEVFATEDIVEHALSQKSGPYLGRTIKDKKGEIQIIDIKKLLPDEVKCTAIARD
ncbi:MAG: chemotaxis protein CheW [Gammaproteobacteria bacterium]|nr:chemotaxis protein CheW [Gammaproteobacteria bacterium]